MKSFWIIGVSTCAGFTLLTRIISGPSSSAIARMRPTTPNLLAT
ncbi:hypothetical protein MLGJGCBP_04054 [Rhodococcus sp. T7]|nr:hypothetical protein MLGJGCBP_04054 [Rhodococcus sp. T7]